VVTSVNPPTSAVVGDSITITYTIQNSSINPAYGNWTDALYLSADSNWDLGDILLGKVDHSGGLSAGGEYSGTLTAKLPPLKDGSWRIIVRPDLFNDVYEGPITYTSTGLNISPGEANNRTASGDSIQVTIPELMVASPLNTTLVAGQARLYKVSVASGETLRVSLDSSATDGANELYIRYGDIPTGFAYDAMYSIPVGADQEAFIPSTQAGDYYILVKSRATTGASTTPINVTLRADLLPLSITTITPDQGGVGDDAHRWVTMDIFGAHFAPGALVKLSEPGVFEVEPARWQVLDATHIQAIFDLRNVPLGLYDVSVTNPDGQRVTEAYRYLVERAIEADVTIGIGGARTTSPGSNEVYSVSLQSLTNIDTPYVRFDVGSPEMGPSSFLVNGEVNHLLGDLALPYIIFGTNIGGQPDGSIVDGNGNIQTYGVTPTSGTTRSDIPWASLDGLSNTNGINLAPGYALDVAAGGFVGMSFNIQTYPGLAEWMAYDFEGFRDRMYALHPDWRAEGKLDAGVSALDSISAGLTNQFLSQDPKTHLSKFETLSLPFQFNVVGAATALSRDEFILAQTTYALQLRNAILADTTAPDNLTILASDQTQWVQGWLGALEASGLLRPADQAPAIRSDELVISLNATLASGILLSKAGDEYRTQADLISFFGKVQQWYGDTSKWAGDPAATVAQIDHYVERVILDTGEVIEVPVYKLVDVTTLDQHATQKTQVIDFNVFAGFEAEVEYLANQGLVTKGSNNQWVAVGAQALNLTQYLQLAAIHEAEASKTASIRGPQGIPDVSGTIFVPASTALPYSVGFNNPTNHALGQLRILTELDPSLDMASLRLGDLKLGDINIHVPGNKAAFQGDFDFTATKGFILRVSAGIDASTRIATWLVQAIDPDTGDVMHDITRGLLAPASDPTKVTTPAQLRGSVSYTISASSTALSGATITSSARIIFDDAPPIDTGSVSNKLDAVAPTTTIAATALGVDAQGVPSYDVQWQAIDDLSGIKHVTVYVAANGGDFKIWQRQVSPDVSQALFIGEAGSTYEFLAVATDIAGNMEAALIANAVLPDDGSRQAVLDGLGINDSVTQSTETPLATEIRSYPANTLFETSTQHLPGFVAAALPGDLQTVLAPFTLRGFADGFNHSDADIGALAMVELPDHSFLASAGTLRNEVYHYSKDGGHNTTPLFTLDAPILDMAVDAVGQLWIMTGKELLLVDVSSGTILRHIIGPNNDPLTHALAIQQSTGLIYVSSGSGIEIFDPNATPLPNPLPLAGEGTNGANSAAQTLDAINPSQIWRHFSNTRVGDLAFAPDGRLWAVVWSGTDIESAQPGATTDIVSFPMSGRTMGRAELEYRLSGVIDSITFGAAGTDLDGLMFASSNNKQHPTLANVTPTAAHDSAVWMIELTSKRILQVATGGTRGESIIATSDGRILIAETGHIDEIAPLKAPNVTAISIAEGALIPLPLGMIAVSFDQNMWTGAASATAEERALDLSSVLNTANFTLTLLGSTTDITLQPQSITWNAVTRTAMLSVAGLPAGQYRLEVSGDLRSSSQVRIIQSFHSSFTAVLDFTSQLKLDFTNTRADRATGAISYDVSITNIGTDDLNGPITLLLDPGRYFGGSIMDAVFGNAEQSDLWLINLSDALQASGGKLLAGATISNQTITVVPDTMFGAMAGAKTLAKADLGHGIYALPQENLPPTLSVVVDPQSTIIDQQSSVLPVAIAGAAWTAAIKGNDGDGILFYWQLVQAPAGVTLTPSGIVSSELVGYSTQATLNWAPTSHDRADSDILVRVQDSRGGVVLKRFTLQVAGGNYAPVIDPLGDFTLTEGQSLALPISAMDADGDPVTVSFRNLPAGASYNATTGLLSWTPSYDQAGVYENISIVVSDGKTLVQEHFSITVAQGYAKPVLGAIPAQTLREGDAFALQLLGSMPGGLTQADGTSIKLTYSAPWLPGGATLNTETGWFAWTPGYATAGNYKMPITVTATYTPASTLSPQSSALSPLVRTSVTSEIVMDILNANGAPVFDAAETWNILEGQPLRISLFAFDPDNPGFEPQVRLSPTGPASETTGTAATVTYQVIGLPDGATFDTETLELVWTPGYQQSGTYYINVIATDDGNGTGSPLSSEVRIPIVVRNANRAPDIGDIANAFVDKGTTLDIPVTAVDADGNPMQLTLSGLPRFATYTQTTSVNGSATGTIHFAPGSGDRGDYVITVIARDNGSGDVNQVLTQAKSFILTVRSVSEAPVISVPKQIVVIAGQAVSLPVRVSDIDQDALTFSAQGLPTGATLTAQAQYGHALLNWTPGSSDIGVYDISVQVTDSGLGPQGAGYIQDPNVVPVPNSVAQTVRIIVRAANETPELLGVQINGVATNLTTDPTPVTAKEGVPLSITISARDTNQDWLSWIAASLPRGMHLDVQDGTNGNSNLVISWTPDLFAAQDTNIIGGTGSTGSLAGHYSFTIKASDGAVEVVHSFDVTVANTNQAPQILPMPLQLVTEGDTLSFTTLGVDADGDPLKLSLIYDDTTPSGVFYDAKTGYFEWTPGQGIVDNATVTDKAYTFTFTANDGTDTTIRTVQVRVFDVNRQPQISTSNHAVVVGESISLPVNLVSPSLSPQSSTLSPPTGKASRSMASAACT